MNLSCAVVIWLVLVSMQDNMMENGGEPRTIDMIDQVSFEGAGICLVPRCRQDEGQPVLNNALVQDLITTV